MTDVRNTASLVQLTRDEGQVRRALRRVENDAVGSALSSHNAGSVAHMFFAEGVRGWLATHPSLAQRITALGPVSVDDPLPTVNNPGGYLATAAPTRLLDVVGSLNRQDLDYAVELRRSLPEALKGAVEDPVRAQGLVYLLLLHQERPLREQQWREVARTVDPEVLASIASLSKSLGDLQVQHRLPVLEMALPSVRGLGGEERRRFLRNIDQLIATDGKTDLFELVVQCIVHMRLSQLSLATSPPSQASECRTAARTVLTLLARLQEGDEKRQVTLLLECSFDAGYDPPLEPDDEAAVDPQAVRRALDVLRRASPKLQRSFLTACEALMLADGALDLEECELFRAIVLGIGAPVPARAVQPHEPMPSPDMRSNQ